MEVNNLVYEKKYKKYKTKYLELKKQFGGDILECNFFFKNVSNAKLVMDKNRKCTLEDWKKFDLKVLKDAGATIEQLKERGYDINVLIQDLKNAGYTILDFKNSKLFSIEDLKKIGYTIQDFKDNKFTIQDLKNAGYTIQDFKDNKFTIQDLKNAGYTIQDFKDNKFKDAGYTIQDFKQANYKLDDIINLGFSYEDIKKLGVKYLSENKFSAEEMKVLGFTGSQISQYYTKSELQKAGYNCYRATKHSRVLKCE